MTKGSEEGRFMRTIGRWGTALSLLVGLGVMLSGCGGQRGEAAGNFKDPNPLPADTLTYAAPEIGNYGGRFVLGQTSSPKTFNAIMANETSSTDVTQLLF